MRKKKIFKLSTIALIIGSMLYMFICYSRIASLNLAVNPLCKECFSPSKSHAGCVIFKDNKVLLVKDKVSKKYGFPAGMHEFGERAFQTAYRETLDETGLHTFIDKYIVEFEKQHFRLFKCNIIEDTKKHDKEVIEFKYFSKEELKELINVNGKNARYINQMEYLYKNFDDIKK